MLVFCSAQDEDRGVKHKREEKFCFPSILVVNPKTQPMLIYLSSLSMINSRLYACFEGLGVAVFLTENRQNYTK